MLLGLSLAWSGRAGEPGPIIPKGKGEQCVAETSFMRRNHMDLIKHQRDETVIRGIRGEPFSLVECVDCHAQQNDSNEFVRVDEDGQFCSSCHTYVGLQTDCFSCHAAVPDSNKLGSVDNAPWLPHKQMLAFKVSPLPLSSADQKSLQSASVNSQLNVLLKPALERDRNELNNTKPK